MPAFRMACAVAVALVAWASLAEAEDATRDGTIKPKPHPTFEFGGEAWYLAPGAGQSPLTVQVAADCQEGKSKPPCSAHRMSWLAGPTPQAGTASVLQHGKDSGYDFVVCRLRADGSLTECQASSDAATAVWGDLASSFTAPRTADDGFPLGDGFVGIRFDWARLAYAANEISIENDPVRSAQIPPPGQLAHDQLTEAFKNGKFHYYPDGAMRSGQQGAAVIDCFVDRGGYLSDCRVVSETPAGYGFGAAALTMAPLFKVRPKSPDAKSGVGTRVQMPIAFKL